MISNFVYYKTILWLTRALESFEVLAICTLIVKHQKHPQMKSDYPYCPVQTQQQIHEHKPLLALSLARLSEFPKDDGVESLSLKQPNE